MKHSSRARTQRARTQIASILTLLLFFPALAGAQGLPGPLTVEGLHQQNNPSASSRAFGGVTAAMEGDVDLMFLNPAAMHSSSGIQVSVGGVRQYTDRSQEQHFAPVRYYPNLSLLLEGWTDRVPDPDPSLVGFTPADSVQRPFDDIDPDWSRSNTNDRPLHALVAVPVAFDGFTLTAGVGAVQYANLNHYDQNNNALDPAVLSQRPLPTLRPTDDDPVTVGWYQSIRSREGSIRGYGVALAGHVERYGLTVGVSGLLLDGEADDLERRVDRGTLTFLANEFRADSSHGRVVRIGTSEFSAREFALSSMLHGRYASIGVVVRPPTEFTRSYRAEIETDTTGTPVTSSVSGEDSFRLPWRGSVGLLLKPRERLHIGLEYEVRPYASASYQPSAGAETSPWASSSVFRVGAEYELFPWLALRGGMRGDADVFVPDGNAFVDDPVSYRILSAGFGLSLSGVRWNVAYEHADVNYQDIWGSALSKNQDLTHTIVMDISITIPTTR